jgi:uncharacterized protein (DUF302 family)
MIKEPAIVSYLFSMPLEKAIKKIKSALNEAEISVIMESDVALQIKQKLGVGLAPCRILYVESPLLLLEALAFDVRASVFLPFHIVVSSQGVQTKVHLMSPALIHESDIPVGIRGPLRNLHCLILGALEKVSARQGICELTIGGMDSGRGIGIRWK